MKDSKLLKLIEECLKFKPVSNTGEEWICHTCFKNLKDGKMPAQAIANDLELKPLPPELAKLCPLEERLVAQAILFSVIVSLKGNAYTGVKGETCSVPIEPDRINATVQCLPRRLDDANIVPLKLKRRLRYHGYFMRQLIRPKEVEDAFHWLVRNNKFYQRNIAYNADWYILTEKSPMSLNLKKLLSFDHDDIPRIENHEEGNNLSAPENEDADIIDESTDKDVEDEVDGKNLLYNTMFVNEIPTLPVKEDKTSFSIAPGEGHNLISKRTKHLHQLAFPTKFPYGECSLDIERKVKLSTRRYFNSLITRQNSRCTSPDFLFSVIDRLESEQMQNSITFQSKKGFGGNLQTKKGIEEAIKGNKAWSVFKQVRPTPGFWEKVKKDVMAMFTLLGPPSFWATFSANDLNWVTPIKLIAAQEGIQLSDEEVKAMSFLERVKWINKNPAAITTYIFDVFRRFMYDFILKTKVFGKVKDYVVKVEFQQRGTPHIHMILWVDGAPLYGVNSDKEVADFVDKYITSKIPSNENDPLYHLVKTCQTHRCLKTKCKSKKNVA